MKLCCCLVLNYNDWRTTLNFIRNIRNFKNIDYILVVDNHSKDNSYEVLKKEENEKTIVVQCNNNGGYGAGNNYGVMYAHKKLGCDYVIISNPDVIFDDSTVKEMIVAMDSIKSCAVVSTVQYDINRKIINNIAWKIPTAFRYAFTFSNLGTKFANTLYPEKYFDDDIVEVDCVPGAMLMVNANLFIDVKGYDERMFLYCEEDTLGFKLKQHEYKTILLTKEHYIHEHGVSINKTIKGKITQLKMVYKSKLFFMKNYLNANFIVMLIARINIFLKISLLRIREK